MKTILMLAVALLLAGCGPGLVERQAEAVCTRQGFAKGTPAYAQCFGGVFAGLAL